MKISIKNLTVILLVLMTSTLVLSCKKGDNDPFLSLRSRKARIVGEWQLQKGFEKSTGTYPESIVYNETTGTKTDESGTIAFTYSMEYTFKNDGSYSASYTETPAGGTSTVQKAEGRWLFMEKNKSGKVKNKESILLTETQFSYTSGGNNSSNTDSNPTDGELWYLDQLENKMMIVKSTSNSTSVNGGVTETGTTEMEYTFIAK